MFERLWKRNQTNRKGILFGSLRPQYSPEEIMPAVLEWLRQTCETAQERILFIQLHARV